MKNHKLFQQIIVFAIPIFILIGLAIPPTWTSLYGEEIKLKTKPIDPSDLFRGSYVALSYDIEAVTKSQLTDSVAAKMENRPDGDLINVYVQLTKGKGEIYTVKKVTRKRPDSGIYLKGKLQVPYEYEMEINPNEPYHIQYNLDEYYAPSKEAQKIEKNTSVKPAIAIVKVRNGNAVLTDIVTP